MYNDEHLYFVIYDVSCRKRWRKLYKLLQGFGSWVQLSVFQCRLDKSAIVRLNAEIESIIDNKEDHAVIIDVGLADKVDPKINSLGMRKVQSIRREATIV